MTTKIENNIIVLLADEGKKLTNGSSYVSYVYLGIEASVGDWSEINEADIPVEEEYTPDGEATISDYQDALGEMGVKL